MKKPHEQEWTKDEHQMGRINATDAICLDVRVAFWRVPEGDNAAMQQALDVVDFALAAPDMARALLMVVEREDPYSDIHKAAAAALHKAGVL